nr:hypothetical protein A5482_03750 [Cyanobacterium sp. IPPAS B-1200]
MKLFAQNHIMKTMILLLVQKNRLIPKTNGKNGYKLYLANKVSKGQLVNKLLTKISKAILKHL